MAQKGSSRKGMRRRSNTADRMRGESSAADQLVEEVDEGVLHTYLHEVYKLPKEEGTTPAYRVEGELPEPDEKELTSARISPSSAQTLIVDESQWGDYRHIKAQSKGLWRWIAIVISIIIISLTVAYFTREPDVEEKPYGYFLEKNIEEIHYDEAVAPLIADKKIHIKAINLIEGFVKASRWEEVEPMLRPTKDLRSNLRKYWKPCGSLPQLQNAEKLLIDYGHSGKVGYYMIEGLCLDNSPFIYFFINIDGVLKLDWEASKNIGDLTIAELATIQINEPVMKRVVLERTSLYLPNLREEDYESFKLTEPGEDTVIYGYVKRGSQEAVDLDKILSAGGILLEAQNSGRATIMLTPTEVGQATKRFYINRIINHNWVTP